MEFEEKYTVNLTQVVKEFKLKPVYEPENIEDILVERSDASRPALPLTGFFKDFEPTRLQIIGNMEYSYLMSLSDEERHQSLKRFFEKQVVAVIVTSDLEVFGDMIDLAREYKTPL
ncbi:MAG: HPr kinase/phosphorylase, partial [Clostridia bacterium]|nr:HPr kinase/phosphorylase [Clostridia bacterium]